MAPLLKDKTETITTAAESTGAPAVSQGRAASDHMSADAVSLEVPVNIHGSRVTEVVRGVTPHTEPFEEQTTTIIVFPQGGVLRMATTVTVGQMLVLTNLKSRQDAICRVVKVRSYSNAASYVEVEFTHSQAGYWGVFFSSDGPELARKASGNLSLETLEPRTEQKSQDNVASKDQAVTPPARQSKDPSAPSTLGVPANRTESSFISIGSQEEVQLSATSTTFKGSSSTVFETPQPSSAPRKVQPAAPAQPRTTASSREADAATIAEAPITGSDKSQSAPVQSSSSTFGEVFGGSSRQESRETPVIGLESTVASSSSGNSQNWKLIVAGAALGIILAAGGFLLFRPSANGNGAARSATAPVPQVQPDATQSAQRSATQPTATSAATQTSPQAPPPAPKTNLVAETKRTEPVAASPAPAPKTPKLEETPSVEPAKPAPVAKRVPDVTSDLFGSLNAHPVSGRALDDTQAAVAPTVSAPAPAPLSAGNSAALIPAPSAVQIPIPSPTAASGPLQVGGMVPAPRLLSSTLPVYPAAAQQTRTQGDVVLRTVIDDHGRVIDAQVVSGATLLRGSAIEAVKHWRYEPSHVNGKPVTVQMLVTIHFRL